MVEIGLIWLFLVISLRCPGSPHIILYASNDTFLSYIWKERLILITSDEQLLIYIRTAFTLI